MIIIIWSLDYSLDDNFMVKKWDKENGLTWDDFQGPTPIFTTYAAVISCKLYLEYDSVNNKFLAYAGQHNKRSWTKEDISDSEDGLRHEQYHFNIAEIHSRRLNRYLDSFPNAIFDEVKLRKSEIDNELSVMQTNYDDDTDHSLIEEEQNYWEYKIDTELMELEDNNGLFTNYFSGISAKFPSPPDTLVNLDTDWIQKGVGLWKYGMLFRCLVSYDNDIDTATWQDYYDEKMGEIGLAQIETVSSRDDDFYLLETESVDTAGGMNYYDRQLYKYPYKYHITVGMPSSPNNLSGYLNMQYDFLNSIEINPRFDYWMNLYDSTNYETKESLITKKEKEDTGKEDSDYYRFRYPGRSEFSVEYQMPFKYKNKILLPFKILKHSLEEVEDVLVVVNDRVFGQKIDSTFQLIALDKEVFNVGQNWIHFGYVLKVDSLSDEYYLYGSVAEYWVDN